MPSTHTGQAPLITRLRALNTTTCPLMVVIRWPNYQTSRSLDTLVMSRLNFLHITCRQWLFFKIIDAEDPEDIVSLAEVREYHTAHAALM